MTATNPRSISIDNKPCGRCGSTTVKREESIDINIECIYTCVMCGDERVIADDDFYKKKRTTKFKETRIKVFRAGVRKYRSNDNEIPFQGSPIDVAQKNLASATNCIVILSQNMNIPKDEVIVTLLNQVFNRLEEIRPLASEVVITVDENKLFQI